MNQLFPLLFFVTTAFSALFPFQAAKADVITFTVPYVARMVFMDDAYSGATGVRLPRFNPRMGMLDDVRLSLTALVMASATAENNETVAGTFVVRYPISFEATGPGNQSNASTNVAGADAERAASDGIPGQGPDFIDFEAFVSSMLITVMIPATGVFNSYIGAGQFAVLIEGLGELARRGTLTDVTLDTRFLSLNGNVAVQYTFTPAAVPEPSSLMLATLGLLAGAVGRLFRRRA